LLKASTEGASATKMAADSALKAVKLSNQARQTFISFIKKKLYKSLAYVCAALLVRELQILGNWRTHV
jgi:hypothetical protein